MQKTTKFYNYVNMLAQELEETIEILKNDLEASEIELSKENNICDLLSMDFCEFFLRHVSDKFRKRYLEAKSVVESYVERNSRLKEELRLKEVEDSEQNLNLKVRGESNSCNPYI